MSDRLSPQEALINVMVVTSAADRTMLDAELGRIGDIVKTLPAFEGFDLGRVGTVATAAVERLKDEDGIDAMLDLLEGALPERFYETAYALAVEVAAADLVARQEELRFLQMLRERLDIDPLAVAAIERSARVRYRKA